MDKCQFDVWYRGKCNKQCVGSFCDEHLLAKCHCCGGQAVVEDGVGSVGSFAVTDNICRTEYERRRR